MDNILSLFEIVTSPNNHAVVFKDYLQICTENQVFINKTPKELKPVVTYINNKLNATSNRIEGLHVLQTFLPQCSKDIFRENALMWLQQCLKSIDGTSISITILAYKLIKTLLEMTQQLPEMRRTVSSIVVSKLIENLQLNIQSECLLAILQCIETLMFNYGPTCGHNKNVLEKILLQYIDSPDNNVVIRVARCMAQMPLLSNAGPLGANHTSRWIQELQRLCATLHGILDELFVPIEENENMFNIAIPSSKLPLPEISNLSTTLTQVTNLVRRFVNVAEILRGLFLVKFTAEKTVQIELVLQLIYRGLNVTDKSFSNTTAAEVQMIRALLPRIQVNLLRVLSSVIKCLGCNLIPHGLAIMRIIYHTLSWTATECPYGVEKPYREVRATACDTFALWLQTAMTGSCVERVADKFADILLPDINPGKTAVTLIDMTPKKGSSKQLKKSAIAERSKQAATIAPDLELYILHQKANRRVCRAALKVMQWMFVSSSMFLNTFIHEKLQNITVKLLVDIQRSGQQHLVPIPYSDGQCREELYNLLLMIVMNPHPLRPVPVDQALAIFANGCKDAHIETAATCKIGLNMLEKLISGVRPSQHFPLTVEEMLDSMNVEQENMEQDIEDEVEQIEDEVVEEEEEDDVEEEEEEEDDEEEEEEEEEEVEDEMPKIKIGEAITLAPNKATPKQMVVEEERSAKKIENKTFQQPVEKPEANKKDEDDVVEVLTEDEMPWDVRKVRKEKMTSEADEMLEDEEEYGSEEDEEGMEIGEDEELEDEYEDEEDIAEVESEGEEMEHTFIAHNKVIKSMPVEVEKKDVTKSESKYNIQRTLVTHQEIVNEVALSSTEHMHSQDKVSLPSANGFQEKAKELDSSIEEVQEEIVEPSSEVLQSSAEESQEQNEVVVHTATEEIQMVASPAEQEHITEKISINSQNEIENNTVVEEVSEVQDLEDHIAVSVVENKRMRREYEDIDDRDEVHDEDNDDGMHEECDEQMEEENAYESRNDVPVEHQEENQNELHYASDKMTTESDKDITEEPVDEALVNENVCEAAGNELIQNDDATFESEVVQEEDNTTLKPEVSDEMEKQEALEEGSDGKKEDTCEEEVASEQYSDIPKPEGYVLNDENCIDKENTVVDSGDSEVNMATISETNLEADNVQMDDKEIPETEINAATKKVPHTSEHEEPEEPSRKKMKMDITATLADGPKTVDTEISNADVKVNNTSDSNKTEVVLNGITKTADEITDEEFIAAFVPDVSPDELK